MKEIAGIIAIITIVCISSFMIQSYLENTSNELISKLYDLKDAIKQEQAGEKNNNASKIAEEVLNKWDEIGKMWSMIVIHQELDNIKLSMLEVKAALDIEYLEDALEEIDKTIFLVGHIKEKELFGLKNIF